MARRAQACRPCRGPSVPDLPSSHCSVMSCASLPRVLGGTGKDEMVRRIVTSPRPASACAAGRPRIPASRPQTNEPARCATLLPALAQLPPPLALIEVGASAGLTLLVDRYSYDYAGHRIAGQDSLAPTLRCSPRGPVPLPARLPEIAWRAGLDLD